MNVCYSISKKLIQFGHEVTIVTTNFELDEDYAKSMQDIGVKVIPFKCIFNIKSFLISPELKNWAELNIKYFDIVVLHTFRSYQNNIIFYYAQKFSIPYIVQANGSVLRIVEKQNLKRLYDLIWGYKLLRNAHKVIAVSKCEAEQYMSMGVKSNKIVIIPNALDSDRFKQLPKKGVFRQKLGIHSDAKMVLYLGRLHKRKQIELLITAFKNVLNDIDNAILIVGGPNQDHNYVKDLMKLVKNLDLTDKVIFTGYLDDILQAYCDADVLVYPAVYEIFGLVPFEAIMSGTIVIVSDDCGCGEFIGDAKCGYLMKSGDIDDMKLKILGAFGNNEENQEMIKRGQEYIVKNLSWNEVTKKFIDTCFEIVGGI